MTKIAVIGTGYWGKNHVRAYNELKFEGVIDELTICDVDERRAKEFSNIYHIPYTTDYNELLSDDSLSGVSIATPTPTHFELAKKFMEAGVDVFVEKPITTNSKEAKELIRLAEEKKKLIMVGHIFRHHSAVKELVRVLKPGNTLVVSVPRYWPERLCWALSDDYANSNQGHIRIYKYAELITLFQRHGLLRLAVHYAHSLHSPYWWLKCLLGPTRTDSGFINLYHRFLTWDIMKQPKTTRLLDRLLNPVLGKSIVVYLKKIRA